MSIGDIKHDSIGGISIYIYSLHAKVVEAKFKRKGGTNAFNFLNVSVNSFQFS